jgi:hypothetical protein
MVEVLTAEQRAALADLDHESETIGWWWDGEAWQPLSSSIYAERKQDGVTK